MADRDFSRYGSLLGGFLEPRRLAPLGPGVPNRAVKEQLAALTPEQLLGQGNIRDRDMAACCLAGLWLYHDCLDESHTISQSIDSTTGSFWHAIMHRREHDFGNSKYWFRHVGTHAIFEPLRAAAAQLAAAAPAQARLLERQTSWDPFAFVDLCEKAVRQRGPLEELCREVQMAEWELLFDHCFRQAITG